MKKTYYLLVIFAIGFQIQTIANTITGKISDLSDNAPVEGLYVYLYNTDFIDSTDVNGEFSIDSVPVGTYTIIIDHPDYVQKVIKDFKVTNGVNSIEIISGNSLLVNCYPNPFINTLNIEFSIEEPQNISIEILNIRGQVLKVIENRHFMQGKHSVVWNGDITGFRNSAGNIYFCRIRGAKFSQTNKIIKIN